MIGVKKSALQDVLIFNGSRPNPVFYLRNSSALLSISFESLTAFHRSVSSSALDILPNS